MNRFTLEQVQTSERFYKIPKALFEFEKYLNMKIEAKMAYAILKDRFELSIKNGWTDKENHVFLIYTNTDLVELLGFSEPKVIRIKKELEDYGLLEQVRQGLNKPNLLYLGNVEIENVQTVSLHEESTSIKKTASEPLVSTELTNLKFQNLQNLSSRTNNSLVQDLTNFKSSDTEKSDTDKSEINDDEEEHAHVSENVLAQNSNRSVASKSTKNKTNELLDQRAATLQIGKIIESNPAIRPMSVAMFDELIVNNTPQALQVIDALDKAFWRIKAAGDQGNESVLLQRKLWGNDRAETEILRVATQSQVKYMADHLVDFQWYGQYFSRGLFSRIETALGADSMAM
jgi:hypothetical protein